MTNTCYEVQTLQSYCIFTCESLTLNVKLDTTTSPFGVIIGTLCTIISYSVSTTVPTKHTTTLISVQASTYWCRYYCVSSGRWSTFVAHGKY